jgi:hypothetical protein
MDWIPLVLMIFYNRLDIERFVFVDYGAHDTVRLTWRSNWVIENIDDIPMRSQTPSLAKMKRFCACKFVRSSYIGGDISDQNYLEITVSLIKMTSFSL